MSSCLYVADRGITYRNSLRHSNRRAEREWDKVWRGIDARNCHKSLDNQAATDTKAITQKGFVTQVEAVRDEQGVTRASLVGPFLARTKPSRQLEEPNFAT